MKGKRFNGDARELTKYVCKGVSSLPDGRLLEFAAWAKGKRFLSTFGQLYNNPEMRAAMLEQEEPEQPCSCGCCDFERQLMQWDSRLGHYVIVAVDDYHVETGEPPGSGPGVSDETKGRGEL